MNIFMGFKTIWNSIVLDLNILWILLPVFITWLIVIFYFAKFKTEDPTWRAFLQNSVALVWITFDSIREIFSTTNLNYFWIRFGILCFILIYALGLFYTSFTHKGPFWLNYFAMPTPIYFLAITSILWRSQFLIINSRVIFSFIIIFLTMLFFSFLIRKSFPNQKNPKY